MSVFYETALRLSPSKQVIEDFITDGIKVDVYYYVKDNEIIFLGSSDTIMCKGDLGAKILQKAWPFKSKYEKDYLKQVDGKVRDMFNGLAINNAYATMSMFYRNGNFYFFEAGFRLSGEMSYHYYEKIAGINYLDSMIKHSMGYKDNADYKEVLNCNNHCIVLNFFGLDGDVDNIKGLEELKKNDNIYEEKSDRNGNPDLLFSAYSSEKVGDNFVSTWVRFLRFPEKGAGIETIKPEWMQPRCRVSIDGELQLASYDKQVRLSCRVSDMKEFIKEEYQNK